MLKTTHENEMTKRKFFDYLKKEKGFLQSSADAFEDALVLWQKFTKGNDITKLSKQEAGDFANWLKNKNKEGSDEKVSLSFSYDMLRRLRRFFLWLVEENSGYRSKIKKSTIDRLNLNRNERREVMQVGYKISPPIKDMLRVVNSIKIDNEVDKRDRALISLIVLTGARISAIRTLGMRHFDKTNLVLKQNPKTGVKTKFSKNIISCFLPIPSDEVFTKYFIEWFDYLTKKGYEPNDPLFPSTEVKNGDNLSFVSTGNVTRNFWKDSNAIRALYKKRFFEAGVTYCRPHSVRDLIVNELTKQPLTEEQKKAISQNLGHENIGTTFDAYGSGKLSQDRQLNLIRSIKQNQEVGSTEEKLDKLLAILENK